MYRRLAAGPFSVVSPVIRAAGEIVGDTADTITGEERSHAAGKHAAICFTKDFCLGMRQTLPVIVHSALFHARRAKPGGDEQPRYFIDVSYCRNGILWPGYPRMEQINAKALEMGAGRGGRYAFLYDGSHFFEQAPRRERLQRAAGSLVLELGE